MEIKLKGKNEGKKFGFFSLDEFKIGKMANESISSMMVDDRIITVINYVRWKYGGPVLINSAGRTPAYNAKIGGEKASYHLIIPNRPVMALDSSPGDGNYKAYKQCILDNISVLKSIGVKNVGFYDDKKFIHLDVGGSVVKSWGGSDQDRNKVLKSVPKAPQLWDFAAGLYEDARNIGLLDIMPSLDL